MSSNQNNSNEEPNAVPASEQNKLPANTTQPPLENEHAASPETPPLILQTEPPMEVHAHTHTPRKKWTHYFWEFFMLFLAVTLGFFVENGREHYIEKLRVKQYASALVYDLGKDTANMNYIMMRIRMGIKSTDSLSAYLDRTPMERMRNIDLFGLSAFEGYPSYRWSRATLEQIKNSGSLRYFNDSIVRLISSYDALSHHMDEDHKHDEEMSTRALGFRNQIIDLNYPQELVTGFFVDIDSMFKTEYFRNFSMKDSLRLLTKDPVTIRVFLNEKLTIKRNLVARVEDELTTLKKQGIKLISLLKKEYHLK